MPEPEPDDAIVLHESLPIEQWEMWTAYRRKKRWPLDPMVLKLHLKKLAPFTTAEQIAMLEKSISSGWQGIFEPKPHERIAVPRKALRSIEELEREENEKISKVKNANVG